MKLKDFEKLSLGKAKKLKRNVAQIRPVLQDLSEEYEGTVSSGDLSQMISSRRDKYWFEEPPKTKESNKALCYLAYNKVISLEDGDWKHSAMHHNNFDIDSYDDEKCQKAIKYIDWQTGQHVEQAIDNQQIENRQLDFSNFQEYYESII